MIWNLKILSSSIRNQICCRSIQSHQHQSIILLSTQAHQCDLKYWRNIEISFFFLRASNFMRYTLRRRTTLVRLDEKLICQQDFPKLKHRKFYSKCNFWFALMFYNLSRSFIYILPGCNYPQIAIYFDNFHRTNSCLMELDSHFRSIGYWGNI